MARFQRDDKHILRFIHNAQEFSNFKVSYKEEGHDYVENEDQARNPIPKGIIDLEQTFDKQDRHKKKETVKPGDYIEVNIGTKKEPKIIKIGKHTSEKKRKSLHKFCTRI